MASIARDRNGTRRLLWVNKHGERVGVRLGKVSQRTAEAIKVKVESLIAAGESGFLLDADTVDWTTRIGNRLADQLAAKGLMPQRIRAEAEQLGEFVDGYIGGRAGLKANTRRNYLQTRRLLIDHFGGNRRLPTITPADADAWRESLIGQGLSPATVSRETKRARQFFRAAVRGNLIRQNPFADLKAGAQVNSSREHFVPREVIGRILERCPNVQWRLIVALSRFGGLRCPSEHLALRWCDIDWERGRFAVRASKTEHHAHGGLRFVPIFPELRPHLEAAFEEAEPGTVHVVTRIRNVESNLRTEFQRIIERAGEKPWPRLFHNLRATRQTELANSYPLHVVCEWLGNSPQIAAKHYLQVTDDHYRHAAGEPTAPQAEPSGEPTGELRTDLYARGAQNRAQHTSAPSSTIRQETTKALSAKGLTRSGATPLITALEMPVPPRGFEPLLPD